MVKLKRFSVAVKIMIDFDFDLVLGLLSLEHERLIACFVVAAESILTSFPLKGKENLNAD